MSDIKKEIRLTVSADDFEFFNNKFKPLCALRKRDETDKLFSLLKNAVKAVPEIDSKTWVTQKDLINHLFDAHAITVNRQLLYDHRQRGQLDGLFVESVADEKQAQRVWFDLDGCVAYYRQLYNS